MERYFIDVSSFSSPDQPVESADDVFKRVNVALTEGEPFPVSGVREGVPIELLLDVSRVGRYRHGGGIVMRFHGVVLQGETPRPFVGHSEESEPPEPITLEVK